MSKKVLNGCKEKRRVILQQTNAHLNYSAAAISCGSFTNFHFQFPFQINLKNFDRTVQSVLTSRLSI